jgi:hypothetical protein
MAHWLPPADEGRIPGYSGYVPGMKNHLVGKRYAEASRRAADATDVLREGRNPGGMTTVSMQKAVHGAWPSCSKEVHDGCCDKIGLQTVQCCWMTVLLLKHCPALPSISNAENMTSLLPLVYQVSKERFFQGKENLERFSRVASTVKSERILETPWRQPKA